MKLAECIICIVLMALFGSIFSALIIPLSKYSDQIELLEKKLERDKFIVNSLQKYCSENDCQAGVYSSSEIINNCRKLWKLDSFLITETSEYYKAEWTFNQESTTYLIKKEK